MQFHEIAKQARFQNGVVSLAQLRRCCSFKQIDRLLAQGFLSKIRKQAFAMPGIEVRWLQRLMAAHVIAPNSVISHRSAARLWGIACTDDDGLDLLTETRRSARSVRWHTTDGLPESSIKYVDGFRVTSPERTIVDLAAVLPWTGLARALDEVIRQGLTSARRIYELLQTRRGSGHHGVPTTPGSDRSRSCKRIFGLCLV
jgi:hypothetical protein